MKTKDMNNIAKKILVLAIGLFSVISLEAQIDIPGDAVWQWSTPVRGSFSGFGKPVAYLWIPENCTKLRGLVVAQNNMQELSILENRQFRDSLASIGFGELWFSPAFSPYFNIQEGAGQLFDNTLSDLASSTGYTEIVYVPLVGIGHSAMANFAFQLMAYSPERALCGISVSAIFPYDYGNDYARPTNCGSNIDYMPYLVCQGEMEGAGDLSNSIFNKSFFKRKNHPLTPITHLPVAGEWHFATSQKKTNFIAYYIKKAAFYRLAQDATSTSYATLTPINPNTTGWLYDRWLKNMRPRYPAAPVAAYTGKRSVTGSAGEENFWAFDEDMAKRIEAYEMSHFRKTPCLIAYNQSSAAGVIGDQVPQTNNHVQCRLQFYPLNDSLDFELSSSFLSTIPAVSSRCTNFMGTTPDTITGVWVQGTVGASIGYPASGNLSVIDRELGPIAKLRTNPATGITTFRMSMERGNGSTNNNFNPVFSVAHPGDATYKASVLQADMWFNVRNTSGAAQTISFPQIADVANITQTVTLHATSNLGLPVQYYVEEGPAKIAGNKIVFTTIPQNAKLPVKVTIVAWQWGRNNDMVTRLGGSLIQSAEPVKNTFYITGRLNPSLNLTFTGIKNSSVQNQLDWVVNSFDNTKTFELQKNTGNNVWLTIKTVAANINNLHYTGFDDSPVNGANYYRLKITSIDGTIAYSNTIVVDNIITSTSLLHDNIQVKKMEGRIVTSGFEIGSDVTITVYDLSGRIVINNKQMVPANGFVITPLHKLSNGVYLVSAVSDNHCKSISFIE